MGGAQKSNVPLALSVILASQCGVSRIMGVQSKYISWDQLMERSFFFIVLQEDINVTSEVGRQHILGQGFNDKKELIRAWIRRDHRPTGVSIYWDLSCCIPYCCYGFRPAKQDLAHQRSTYWNWKSLTLPMKLLRRITTALQTSSESPCQQMD